MTPWDDPHSAADGILDDETYDWLGVFDVMRPLGGRRWSCPRTAIVGPTSSAGATGIPVSATGTAGLAALLPRPARRPASASPSSSPAWTGSDPESRSRMTRIRRIVHERSGASGVAGSLSA